MLIGCTCHLGLGGEMALAWSDIVLSATALSVRLVSKRAVLAMGSSSWVLVHELVHRSRASRKLHLNSYTSPGHLQLSLAHTQVRRMYCVDGNGCKGGVCYVVNVLKCSWETVLRS